MDDDADNRPDDWVLNRRTYTVKNFLEKAFSSVGLEWKDYVETSEKYFRPNEVDYLLGDPSKAKRELNWTNNTSFEQLVKLMVESDINLAEQEKVLLSKNLLAPTWEHPAD